MVIQDRQGIQRTRMFVNKEWNLRKWTLRTGMGLGETYHKGSARVFAHWAAAG